MITDFFQIVDVVTYLVKTTATCCCLRLAFVVCRILTVGSRMDIRPLFLNLDADEYVEHLCYRKLKFEKEGPHYVL
jgi:hypothetical protein